MKVWKKLTLILATSLLVGCASTEIKNPIRLETPPPEGMANVYLFPRYADQFNRVLTFGVIAIADGYLNVFVSDSEQIHNVPKLGNETATVVPVKPGKVEVVVTYVGTTQVKTIQAEAGKNYFFAWNAPSGNNVGGLMLSPVSERNAKHQLMGRSLVK